MMSLSCFLTGIGPLFFFSYKKQGWLVLSVSFPSTLSCSVACSKTAYMQLPPAPRAFLQFSTEPTPEPLAKTVDMTKKKKEKKAC
jgi:hypothetical protein